MSTFSGDCIVFLSHCSTVFAIVAGGVKRVRGIKSVANTLVCALLLEFVAPTASRLSTIVDFGMGYGHCSACPTATCSSNTRLRVGRLHGAQALQGVLQAGLLQGSCSNKGEPGLACVVPLCLGILVPRLSAVYPADSMWSPNTLGVDSVA